MVKLISDENCNVTFGAAATDNFPGGEPEGTITERGRINEPQRLLGPPKPTPTTVRLRETVASTRAMQALQSTMTLAPVVGLHRTWRRGAAESASEPTQAMQEAQTWSQPVQGGRRIHHAGPVTSPRRSVEGGYKCGAY